MGCRNLSILPLALQAGKTKVLEEQREMLWVAEGKWPAKREGAIQPNWSPNACQLGPS
jgi:hypothetical protein